ncbi:hypothetical protein [Hydrogenophaga sp. 2FB]|uniref:hypothetical protein n=1 Tax=Hydrogenophaga sp. 2FB TaxID=2502187 RepID=UPI0010F61816|nr:hypothetical protein [Hydrogenophaga sp. 2FB]
MRQEFQLHPSRKRGLPEGSRIITRGKTVYLRMIKQGDSDDLVTATASEDDGSYWVCSDKSKLVASAVLLRHERGNTSSQMTDTVGRSYIWICNAKFEPGSESETNAEMNELVEDFFRIFDSYNPAEPKTVNDMRDIYSVLAVDDSDDEVYLSDGVWLGSDGSLHDRGR